MASVSFWTPVTYQPFVPSSFGKKLLEKVENFSCWDGKKVCVIPGHEIGKSEGVIPLDEPASNTLLKTILWYTLIFPTLVFVVRVVLRSIYQFHVIQLNPVVSPPPFLGISDVQPPSPPVDDLPPATPPSQNSAPQLLKFNQKYRLSYAEVAKLWIEVPTHHGRGQDFPPTHTDWYRVFPSVNFGFSKLPAYKDSYFEYEYCQNSSRTFDIEVVRRKRNTPFFGEYGYTVPSLLTVEQTIDLKLVAIDAKTAVSVREEYIDFVFEYSYDRGDNCYSIQQFRRNREYSFIPFDRAVELKSQEMQKLELIPTEQEFGKGWMLYHSKIPEYQNSVFLIREGRYKSTCLRMMRLKFEKS